MPNSLSVDYRYRNRSRSVFYLIAFIFILAAFSIRFWLLKVRVFDPDEFEHLHGSWCIFKGMMPYKDYFECHTPFFHFFLSFFYPFFSVETNAKNALRFIFFARQLMWVLTGASLILTFRLGKLWRGTRVAYLGTFFLVTNLIFLHKTLEVRPDVLSLVFWVGSLAVLMHQMHFNNCDRTRSFIMFAVSGALFGAGVMSTQKLLFAIPGIFTVLLWYLLNSKIDKQFNRGIRNFICYGAGFFLPILLIAMVLHFHGALRQFFYYNFILTSQWKESFLPYESLILNLTRQNEFLVGFGLAGLICTIYKILRGHPYAFGDIVLGINLIGLTIGLFIIPVPHLQYHLMFLPLLALFAGAFLIEAIDSLDNLRINKSVLESGLLQVFMKLTSLITIG